MKMTESHNLSADIRDESGNQKVMLHASYGARAFHLTVETLDADYVAQHVDEVQEETAGFISEAVHRASGELAALPVTFGAA